MKEQPHSPPLPDSEGFLFSPASWYPDPKAFVIDKAGRIVHTWSHSEHQPDPADDPPSYLRGWNHVEVDAAGCLLAVVPLRALLKLTPRSELEWACDVAAHHDLAVDETGAVRVLSEAPRRVAVGGRVHTILDNLVTSVSPQGTVVDEVSLFDVLRAEPELRRLIDDSVEARGEAFRQRAWPAPGDNVSPSVVEETRWVLETGRDLGERRRTLQRLRALPGSPCDVLHTNTIEPVADRTGIWGGRPALVCMRELDTIAVVDLAGTGVRWWWGPGELSGPHQPSLLPDGNILVFDNGTGLGRSRVVMVDPRTKRLVWSWSARPPESFFCPKAGGCEQLPNGNLLVTNSTVGVAFELTRNGDVVWQTALSTDVFGPNRGRISIYRMSVVPAATLAKLRESSPPEPRRGGHEPDRTGPSPGRG